MKYSLEAVARTANKGFRFRVAVLALGATVAALGCGDDSAAPEVTPGELTLRLNSPNGAEGALLVEIDGPVSVSNQAVGGLYTVQDGDITRVLVVMDEAGEIQFRITVPDVQLAPEYRIIEVSGPDDSLRAVLDGYTLEFTS